MRYYVTVAGRTLEVDLRGDVPLVDGEPVRARLERIPDSETRHLVVDAASHVVVPVREGDHEWSLHIDGERHRVEVIDERTRTIRAMAGAAAGARGPKPVRAPMPGLVVRLNVAPGDRVEPGQSVVIVEAMKMENDLKAETGGVVKRIAVEAGQPVEKGAVLVEFEAEPEAADG